MGGTITSWGDAIVAAFGNGLNLLFTFIPRLVGFLVILLIGWIVASAISRAVTFLLNKAGIERLSNRAGIARFRQQAGISTDVAGVLGKVVYWFVFLIFLIPAVNTLGLTAVSSILSRIVAFIPNVFVAILVLFLGTLAATFIGDIVRGATANARVGNPSLFGNIARYAVLAFAVLVALEQLNITPSLLNILFTAIVGGVALAAGLAFGLGGQQTARTYLNRMENTVNSAATQASVQQGAQQSINQARSSAQTQAEQQRSRRPNR